MATEADVPDPISVLKREVEDKEMTSELSNIMVGEGPQEEKKKIESWLSQPPEIIEFLGKTEAEEVGNDDEVKNMNVINKGNVETIDSDVFSKSLSVGDEESERYTEHSQMTSEGKKSKASADSVGIEMDPETIRPTMVMEDMKNKHDSSLLDAPVEEKTTEKAGPDVGEGIEENTIMSCKEASQEAVELTDKMNASASLEDEVPQKHEESSFFKKIVDVFFHRVENVEMSAKESESETKDFVKESHHEAEHKNEIHENIATTDSDESKTGMHDEIHDTEADVSFRQPLESPERKKEDLSPTEDNVVAEEQENTETSMREDQSGQSQMLGTEREAPEDSKEIETQGATKYAELITGIEEQRPVGSPEEIVGEERKEETVIANDVNKNEIQEANNLANVDSDEKIQNAELETPNKSRSESWITHPPTEEEVQEGGEKQDEVSMSESGDPHEAIQIPNEEEKHANETSEATKNPESTILEHTATEGELNIEVTSTSEIDINTEKGCELKSEEALKEINAEDNTVEEREQIEKASDTEFLEERKRSDTSTIEEDIPITPLCSGEEEHHQDQEEKVRLKSFLEDITETDSGDQSYITGPVTLPQPGLDSDEINTLNEQIINQEGSEDTKIVDRGENIEQEMENDENTVTDVSPEPTGEGTIKCSEGNEADAKKHKAEASERNDPHGESTKLEESAITDLTSSHVQEEEVEESLKENKREVRTSNIECIERDFQATHSTEERTAKDLKDEAVANEGLNAQSIIVSSEEETAQESNSNLVQSSSVPQIIEKEVNSELLEKEDSKDMAEAEETRLTEVEAEYPTRVDGSNLMSEEKGQVTTETSEMRSNGIDVIAEPEEISILGDDKDMEIPTEIKDVADEETQKNEICDELSKTEEQREIAAVETSLDDIPEQDLPESSIMPLETDNLVAEVSETTGEAPEEDKTLYAEEETPLVATEEYLAEKEDESANQENDTNMGSKDVEKESTTDDAVVQDRELHAPLELNNGKSISESDVELLKGVNAGEAANGSDIAKLEISDNEEASYIGVETDKSEHEEAVNEASQDTNVDGGCIETEKTILEHEDSAKNFEGSSKEGVEIEKGAVDFASEAHSCGSETSENPTISSQTEKKRDAEDKELTSELPNVTVNEVPLQEKKNAESLLSQPPETIETSETECMQVAPNVEVGNVNVVDKGNVGTTEAESFLKSTSVADGKLIKNTEEDQWNTKEEISGFQEDEGKTKMRKDENVIVEASYGQEEGVRNQTPELTEGSSRDIEILNEVPNKDNITSTEATSSEQDFKETSFEGEDNKSNLSSSSMGLEMYPEATQPRTDREDDKSKGKEMPCHGVKDVCISNEIASQDNHETDESTESNVSAKDKLGSSLVIEPIDETSSTKAGPDVCMSVEENSRMACNDESQETGIISERIKDDASIEDDVQNQNLESSFLKKVEDLETSKEESETGVKEIDEETQKEAENQSKTLENTATADRSLATQGEDVDNPERQSHISDMQPEESMKRESEDVTPPEVFTTECEPEVMVVPGEDYVVVEEQETTETSKHDEYSEQSLKHDTEPAKVNMGSPLIVASAEFETTSLDNNAETTTNIEEERPVGIPEEILEKTSNAEIMIPDNSSDEACVTHPPVEETVLEGGEKQVPMSESVDQVHAASASEVPKDEEKHANDSNEASKSPECSISEHTSTEGEVHTEVTTRSAKEIPVGSEEENLGQPREDETMIADDIINEEIPEAENLSKNLSTVDLHVAPPPVEETFLEEGEKKNDVYVLESGNQVYEASEVPGVEEKDGNDTYEATKSPEINILEQTSKEGAPNMEATSTRSAADITLEKCSELISEDELKEINAEENKEEVTEQKEKADVAEFQIPTKSDDEGNSTIKGESLVESNTPTCTGEGEYHHDQEDEVMLNRSKEASPALDSEEQSCSTSDEIKIIDGQIMNEEASNVHWTAPASMTTEECSISDLPSSLIVEEKVEERLKEDRGDETKSKIEVANSHAECMEAFDAMHSMGEREDMDFKHEAEANEDFNAESITELPSEETTQKERNIDLVENSSVPEIHEKEIEEEASLKEDSVVPVAAEETILTRVEGENIKGVDSSDVVAEENLPSTKTREMGSNAVARTEETSILGENNDAEVPPAREVATVEHDETAAESMAKDKDNRKFPETNLTNSEGERQDDENQIIASTDEQITRRDIQEGKKEMNEEMEPKFETQDEINGTQDAILTEKVSTEIDRPSERETIKEQNMKEESCTKELHMSPAADETVPTVVESTSESEIIKGQITKEESCTKELHKITLADETVDEVRDTDLTPIQNLEATASNKSAEMTRSNIAEDLNMESEVTQKGVNETGFHGTSTEEVTYSDLTAINSLEATASNKITEMMESKTAQDLNEESETSPMTEVLEDETKNIEKPVDGSSLIPEGSEEKMKGEKIEDTESRDDVTDIAPTAVTDLSSLGEVKLNDEPVKALDTSSDAESLQTTKPADASEQELEETSIIVSHFPIKDREIADNATIHVEKSGVNDAEVEVTEIPDSVSQTEDQAVKEIHETGASLNVVDADTQEIEKQIREVPEMLLEPTNQHDVEAGDDEINPCQAPQAEKTGEQRQVPSSGLLSEEHESETTTEIEKGSTNKDAMEEAKIRQAEIREELETTSEGEGIENQVQAEENRAQDLSTVCSAEESSAESYKDNSMTTKLSAQEVLETNHGGHDIDEPVKDLPTRSDTESLQTTETSDASQQELEKTSRAVSPFPVEEHEKSENISANVDKSDAVDAEEKEFQIHGDVPEPTDQKVQEIQETGASLPVGEVHTTETANQIREAPEAFSESINQCVEAVGENEIIAPAVAMGVINLGEVQLNEHMETIDANSGAKNLDTIKTGDASQQNAEFENMKLDETCIMAPQPPIHEPEEANKENIPLEKSEANYVEVEETKISDTVPESDDQVVKEIHETGTNLNVGDSDKNESESQLLGTGKSKGFEALPPSEPINQCVDAAGHDEITSGQILQGEKLEEQLQAPSSGLLSKEEESETTTTNEKGGTDKDAIEGTTILQPEIREEFETTGEGKETENQVHEEEKRVQDRPTLSSAEELDTKSSKDDVMITKTSKEEVLKTNYGGQDTDEHVKALDTSSATESQQTAQTPDASQQELKEISSVVSQLPVHIYEKADNESVTVEKSNAYNVEVKETDLPGVIPESKDQRFKDIHEAGTSVEETQTNEMETQTREVREAWFEDVIQGGETVSGDEIVAPSEATKVTTLGEHVEAPDTIQTGDVSEKDAESDIMKSEETSIMVSQFPIHEDEKEESANRPVEKSDANEVKVEEAEITDIVPEPENQAVKEIHETSSHLTAGGADTNEIENQIREVSEALSEPINPCSDTSRDDEMAPVQTLQDEKMEEQLQVPSSDLFSKEEDGETSTAIEKGSTDEDGTEVGNLELQENYGSVFQLPTIEVNSTSDLIEEKSDADEVELIETKTLDAVSESKDQAFEAIHEIQTMAAAEDTETDKVEEEIKEVTEKAPDLRYMGVDAATDSEILNHPLPVGKLEEQIQLSSSSYESTKEDATDLDKSELEEATDMLSKLPTTEHGIRHVGTTIEKSEADEVQVEEAKTSEAISESKADSVEEIKKIWSSIPVGNTCTDEVKQETKAVPETIFEPTYHGAETTIDGETAINQTLTPQGVEQLQEPKSTTEKPCLLDEGPRELEVSDLELKLQKDSQDISPEEENTGLEKGSPDAPLQYEERTIQYRSQEASTEEDIVYSKNSNNDADNLPTPYSTVTALSTEDIGGKCEEASNLEFEKNGKVLLESASVFNSPEAPLTTERIEVKEEHPKETTTELGDGENRREEGTEEEAIEKYTSKEKTSEEMQGSRDFVPISFQEETATKTNQEDELGAEDYPGERTNIIFEASRNEVQHEMVFEESEEAHADQNAEEAVTADDKGPYQVSVGDEIANATPPEEAKDEQNIQKTPNLSELKSHSDELDFTGTATEATALIKELKSSEAMLISHEVERTGDNDEKTVISKDGQLQNTALAVPPVADAAAEKAPDGKELETFDDFSVPALEGPTQGIIEPYEHEKEIDASSTINSESLVDNEKLEHTFIEAACEGSGGTEDLNLTNEDGSNKPSFSPVTETSQEAIADEESEKAVDAKQHDFTYDEPTAEPASIPEEGNSFQLDEYTKDKEPVELSAMADEAKLDENKIQAITVIEEGEIPPENEKPNVLPHIKDSEKEVSHEEVTMNVSEDIQGLEKTSLAIPREQIASKTDPSESIEHTNPTASKGLECGEENRMGEKSKEITEDSQMTELAKMSLSDLIQRSTKQNLHVAEDLTEERELMGNKEEPQNETAETVQAEQAAVHETIDEEVEGDELKGEDSGSDAPVMVEASRDMNIKTAHKKSHHNILSGVGSKVKHSLAKVKKAITGKSSHPKPTSPK